ncbi:MAG: helix-turn-helix domain-containing protein [Lachnospiraceae bacterium]
MQRFETKFDLLKAAYNDDELKKSAVALLQYLVHKSNKEQCFPAVETIAKAMNVCKRTVQYNMRKLEAAGYIIRKDRYYNHQQLSNQYIFNFGIVDEQKQLGENLYSDSEKEELNEFLFNNLGKNSAPDMEKSKEVIKIYNMNLSKYEKLLLIYLLHKADKYAFVYEEMSTYMKAIGVCRATFVRLLNGLRKKGLILVKSKQIGQQELLTIKLTRIVYDDKNMDSTQNTQNKPADQHQDMGNLCTNLTKRNNLYAPWSLPGNFIGYIRRISGRFLKQIRKLFSRYRKNKKQIVSKLFRLIGSIFSLE